MTTEDEINSETEQYYSWADEAVGEVVIDFDSRRKLTWYGVTPKNLGLSADDWLRMSERMVRKFNILADGATTVEMSEAQRAADYQDVLINFAIAIADLADQTP